MRLIRVGILHINNVFLNGDRNEDVSMTKPEGFIDPTKPHYICRLRKTLYGLKQALTAWFDKLKIALLTWGFKNMIKTNMIHAKPSPTPMCLTNKLSLHESTIFDQPSLYRRTVGALQYLTLTCLDLSFSVNKLIQYL